MNFGSYYPAGSFWHRRDPRVKMAVLFILVILVFLERKIWWQAALFALIGGLFLTSALPVSRLRDTLRSFRWLLGVTFLVNLFFTPGGKRIPGLPFTETAVAVSFIYLGRLVNLLLLGAWLMGTTDSLTMIKGIEGLLRPARRFLPVSDIALVLGISLRFFPLLLDESQEITMAQRARGVSFQGRLWRKTRGIISMVVPLFLSTLRRASELAQAMEARGFVPGAARTSYEELRWKAEDTLIIAVFILTLVAWCFFRNYL